MDINSNLPVVAQPNIVISPHPLSASFGREIFYDRFIDNENLGEYLDRLKLFPIVKENFRLTINGRCTDFDDIDSIFPKQGDMIIVRAIARGGDDGGQDKILTSVLTVAVLVASQGSAAGWVGMMTGTSAAVGSAVILVGGMLLISALVPIKVPSFDESQPSPTYSLSGSSNRARPYEPLPLVFGTVRMYPDHGSRPFTEYIDKDQLLIQVFNFGLSDVSYSDYKIGDTPISDFDDYTIEISTDFTGVLNNFPGNVDSISGASLVDNAGSFIERTSSIDTTRLVIDISGISYFVGREEGLTDAKITIIAEYRIAGSSDPWTPFFDGGNETDIINGDKETLRLSYSRFVSKGQYEVRVQLIDGAYIVYNSLVCDEEGENCSTVTTYVSRGLNNSGMTQFLSFDQLKSYQPDVTDYTNQKRISLSIKANAQLNGRVDAFNAIVSSKVLVWTGAAWVNQISSNPAWQFLSLAKGKYYTGRRIYGAGLQDSRIDVETIKLWGAWCDSKGLECNIVFDSKMTVINMLNTIARCGRAVTTWANGNLGIVYDEANKPATAMFGMSNIILNSFKVNYITDNQVDEVVLAFNNPDLNWKRDTVRTVVPGVVTPINSVTIDIPGMTNKEQAAKEANLLAAEQFYRRRIITWETDIEGLTVQRGDVAILSHDLTKWDYSGRLISGTTNTLSLDRSVPFTPATQHYIGVKFPDGTYEIVDVNILTGEHSIITLTTPISSSPDLDADNEQQDYMWFFAPRPTPGKLVKITDVTPISEDRVRIIATDESDEYYLSESNSYTYITPNNFITEVPIISGLALGESLKIIGSGFGSIVNVSWAITGEYGGAFIRAGDEDTPMRDVGRTLDASFSFEWPVGKTVTVEVTAYNLDFKSSIDSKSSKDILLVGKMKLPDDVLSFAALQNGEAVIFRWDAPADIDLSGTEIRFGIRGSSTWEDATPLTQVTKGTNITSQDVVDGDWTFYAKHKDTSLNYSANATTADVLFTSLNDVIDQVEQAPTWTGFIENFVVHHTGVLVPMSQNLASEDGWDTFDLFVVNPYPFCTYVAQEIDIGFDDRVRISGDIQSYLGPGDDGVAAPKLYVDYKLDTGDYDGFELWSIGEAVCRYVQHGIVLDTSIGVAVITGFLPTIDLKERIDTEQFTDIGAGGQVVTFDKPFHRAPIAIASVVSVASGVAAYATATNITETQATVHAYNTAGTSAGGTVNLTLTGV